MVDIYLKPTHTDRYLDFHSHHDRRHKISTAETLLHRALNLPNTQVGKIRETARVCAALHSNGYPKKIADDVIRKKARPPPPTRAPEELVGMFFKWAEPTNRRNFAVLPYIKGITEPLTRILKEHDIQVTSRPVKTLQQHFPIPKFRPAEDDQCNVIYKIPCASCPWSYIGETKRSFTTRRKEHMRNLKHRTKGSNVAKHAWTFNHDIDFNNSKIIDKVNNWSRKTLESWHTAKTTFLSVEGSSSVCRKLIVFSKLFTRERFYFFLSMNPGNGSSIFLRKRYNVNKRVMRFIFSITCPLTYHLSQTLLLHAISAFKISLYYCINVVKERKGLSCIFEKYVFSPVLFLCMIFVEITFCPSINLAQLVKVLVVFLTY